MALTSDQAKQKLQGGWTDYNFAYAGMSPNPCQTCGADKVSIFNAL